jgi:predicted RNase H-like HicB family nuclease
VAEELTLMAGSMRTRGKKFLVTIERDEDDWFVAECPALPGCVSQGRTRHEAIENIREAIEASLETRAANHIPVTVETVEVEIAASVR